MDISPMGVANRLNALMGEVDAKVAELNAADREATELKNTFLRNYAIAWTQSSGSEASKRQVATRTTMGHRIAADDAACAVRCLQRELDALETRVGVGRSYGAAVRAEAQALGPWTEG